MATDLELYVGPGGWIQAEARKGGELVSRSWVCFARRKGGRWEAVTLFTLLPTRESIDAIPLHRAEVAVHTSAALLSELERRLAEPVPELGTAKFLKAFSGYAKPEPVLVLERPAGRVLSDDFYARVAETYLAASELGMKPRTAIAKAAGVSVEVAGRWIHEARNRPRDAKRKFLPPTEPGA